MFEKFLKRKISRRELLLKARDAGICLAVSGISAAAGIYIDKRTKEERRREQLRREEERKKGGVEIKHVRPETITVELLESGKWECDENRC